MTERFVTFTTTIRCLDCDGDYIAFTDDGGYCLQCRGHVFIYADVRRVS